MSGASSGIALAVVLSGSNAQLLIMFSMMSAQTLLLLRPSQQLCPPATLLTMAELAGFTRLT